MAHPKNFFTRQAELEGLRLDPTGHLERFKDMPGESGPPPRVVAVDFRGTSRVYFASGVDPAAETRVRQMSFAQVWTGGPRLHEALHRTRGDLGRSEFWTYTPGRAERMQVGNLAQKLSSSDERLRHFSEGFFGIAYPDVFAVLAEGIVVAAAASSREDGRSAEAWVFVSPPNRGRGLARQVALAWLCGAQARGLLPFYTHVPDNAASQRLAESLHLSLRFVQASYE
jgi:RimJ/RimL family protein N-acetyltransferase